MARSVDDINFREFGLLVCCMKDSPLDDRQTILIALLAEDNLSAIMMSLAHLGQCLVSNRPDLFNILKPQLLARTDIPDSYRQVVNDMVEGTSEADIMNFINSHHIAHS
uniref:Uncharacterized protein n=1 Tax=Pithovirus LCPAC103 TaxID=2506588 RepID=A0A481Z6R7_9VIRU|nr:MAG: hypothetical protein LCPAC103_00920 [Pithovirus LCPAC103]